MAGNVYAIKADVRIAAPFNEPFTPAGETSLSMYDNSGELTVLGRDILRISVTNDIRSPRGTFSISVVPRPVTGQGDKTWADIIKPYSLVSIAFQRVGDPDDPAADRSPVPMIVGLVDEVLRADEFSSWPQRSQQIVGRSLTGVLDDHRYWFHHMLSEEGFLPPDHRDFLSARTSDEVSLRDEAAVRALGLFAVESDLFFLTERTPIRIAKTGFDFFVRGVSARTNFITDEFHPERAPFIKIHFSDGTSIKDRLVFDPEKAASSYLDQRAVLTQNLVPSELPGGSLSDIIEAAVEASPFTEIFSETIGDTISAAKVELIVRKPPWAGHVDYLGSDGKCTVGFATHDTRPPKMRGQTLFDHHFGGWELAADTITIGDSDVVGIQHLKRGLRDDDVFTLYQITPQGDAIRDGKAAVTWKQLIPPIIEEDPNSPSYIKRYGLRVFETSVRGIPVGDDAPEAKGVDFIRRCQVYATLAREWFYRGPEFWRGQYVLKGNTRLRAGKRLVDRNLSREYYITSVSHRMSFDSDPQYLTTVGVERGWDLATV